MVQAYRIRIGNGIDNRTDRSSQWSSFARKPFSVRYRESIMQPIEGYTEYKRREYCRDVRCPIQLLLNEEVEKSPRYEEIRAICASKCIHSTHEFHRWLLEKGYLIVRPEQQ